jgi:hypothetical protein
MNTFMIRKTDAIRCGNKGFLPYLELCAHLYYLPVSVILTILNLHPLLNTPQKTSQIPTHTTPTLLFFMSDLCTHVQSYLIL